MKMISRSAITHRGHTIEQKVGDQRCTCLAHAGCVPIGHPFRSPFGRVRVASDDRLTDGTIAQKRRCQTSCSLRFVSVPDLTLSADIAPADLGGEDFQRERRTEYGQV